jgi:uncharacterized protein YggT (Ycf19 family)
MDLIHSLLNLAGLLLWLNWRALGFAEKLQPPSISITGVLRKVEAPRQRRWLFLAGLALLLLVRSVFYWQIGAAANWTPQLDLAAVVISFRSDFWTRALLYSLLSFGVVLGLFYVWLLLLSAVNRKVPETDPLQKLVRLHLSRLERWPAWLKLLLPWLLAVLLWYGAAPWLARLGIAPAPRTSFQLLQQSALVGLAVYLAWKFLLVGILFLHLLNSYLYLGNVPFWTFINATARNLLRPLGFLPLRLSKVDFAPLVGIALILLLTESGAYQLARLYQLLFR